MTSFHVRQVRIQRRASFYKLYFYMRPAGRSFLTPGLDPRSIFAC